MEKTETNVDLFIGRAKKWQAELKAMRSIALACGLVETLKWGQPCYTTEDDKNVLILQGFKEYCGYGFFQGALLKDPQHLLVANTENVQAGRQIRFHSLGEIEKLKPVLKAYIREAAANEKAGLKVKMKPTSEFKVPAEFQMRLNKMPALQKAFAQLTPGRQRGYLLYFSQAKLAATREARVDKYLKQILSGKGLDD